MFSNSVVVLCCCPAGGEADEYNRGVSERSAQEAPRHLREVRLLVAHTNTDKPWRHHHLSPPSSCSAQREEGSEEENGQEAARED